MTPSPPRLARWLLSRAASREDRAHLVSDLDEEFQLVVSSRGARAARRWYRSQCLRSLAPLLSRRIRTARPAPRGAPLRDLSSDVRFSLRGFRNRPAFSLAAIATLALGFGAHHVIYSVVRSVLLRDFPYAGAERIVRLSELHRDGRLPPGWTSIPNFEDFRMEAETFSELALYRGRSMALTGDFSPEYVFAALVTGDFFDVFATAPSIGRGFIAEDGEPRHSHDQRHRPAARCNPRGHIGGDRGLGTDGIDRPGS